MAKKKTRSTVSVGSSNSSNSTRPASNVSVSSSSIVSTKSKSSKTKKRPKSRAAPTPPRTPEQSVPVDLDISPAETYDTVPLDESPSRSFDSAVSYNQNKRTKKTSKRQQGSKEVDNNYLPATLLSFESPRKGSNVKTIGDPNKVVIEHKMKNEGGYRSRSIIGTMCLLKPALLFLFIAAVLAGAASVYGWLFKFPDLNRQVKELEDQVFRLKSENDRYEGLNDRLNITTGDLENVRDDLNGTVMELESVAIALNTTTDQVLGVITDLKDQNYEYALLNQDLQNNVDELAGEVNFFREALDELSGEHSKLKATTDSLQELTEQFSNTTFDQQETLIVLKETLEGFQAENDRLEEFNKKLETGLDYLNETLFANGNLVESSVATLSEISEALGERVQQQQQSTRVQLEISYRQLLAGWDCDYNDVFQYGPNSVISSSTGNLFPADLQNYINDRVLSKMCLNSQDFERYLLSSTPSGGITSSDLVRAVALYTEGAMKYYFPSPESSNGITLDEWIDASFRCDLLKSPFNAAQNGMSVRKLKQLFHLRH